jgi:large subunit ribosomal protein L24
MMNKMKLKKGDKIIVLAGKDKGKTGTIERVFAKTTQVVVTGINIVKKHVKVSKKNPAGGVVEISKPMPEGKVAVICPSCNKPTRIGYVTSGKEKNRVCRKCKKVITATKKEVKEKK